MLKLRIYSFSYIYNGIPDDEAGNGGGFVFDCRFIDNPGIYEEYKNLTGKDKKVMEFLEQRKDTEIFLNNVFSLIDSAIRNYKQKEYTDLMVSFGCTGGQHRSVYFAEKLKEYIDEKYKDVVCELKHINL